MFLQNECYVVHRCVAIIEMIMLVEVLLLLLVCEISDVYTSLDISNM